MATITQEFQDINYRIIHSLNKQALTPLATLLKKRKDEYLNDDRISNKVKRMVKHNYKYSIKLIEKMKRRLK